MVGGVPNDGSVVINGGAVGQRTLGGLDCAWSTCLIVGDIVQSVKDGIAAFSIPQQVTALHTCGGQNWGGGANAGTIADLVLASLTGSNIHHLQIHSAVAAASARSVVIKGKHIAVTGFS